ncbi:hypothetical protein CYLTODRAFT_24110, partial [Cylindrobasidium torrendii FP15055 ss-10]
MMTDLIFARTHGDDAEDGTSLLPQRGGVDISMPDRNQTGQASDNVRERHVHTPCSHPSDGEGVEHMWTYNAPPVLQSSDNPNNDVLRSADDLDRSVTLVESLPFACESEDEGDNESVNSCPPLEDTPSPLDSSLLTSGTLIEDTVRLSLGESCVQCSTLAFPGFRPVSQIVGMRYRGALG